MSAGKPDASVARRRALDDLRDDHWILPLGRYLIEEHSTADDFGAVIAFAAVCAWRDRGPGWGKADGENFTRIYAETPPGGWPALAGVTAPTWRARRDRAIEIGLIERRTGEDADGREIALLAPLVNVEEGEQFARVPAAILFHKGLSKTGKRVYCALAMYRTGTGWARAAKATIGTLAGLDRADVSRGLKELVGARALIETGDARTGKVRRWVMPHDYSDLLKTPQSPVKNPTPTERNPTATCQKPHGDLLETPHSPVKNPPPIKKALQESSQESDSGDSGQSPGSPLIDGAEGGKEQPPQDDGQGKRLKLHRLPCRSLGKLHHPTETGRFPPIPEGQTADSRPSPRSPSRSLTMSGLQPRKPQRLQHDLSSVRRS